MVDLDGCPSVNCYRPRQSSCKAPYGGSIPPAAARRSSCLLTRFFRTKANQRVPVAGTTKVTPPGPLNATEQPQGLPQVSSRHNGDYDLPHDPRCKPCQNACGGLGVEPTGLSWHNGQTTSVPPSNTPL